MLLVIYTAASGGTVISAHYCMGDLASISIGERDTKGCAYCGMEDEGCCHDLPQVIKMENSNLENPGVTFSLFHPIAYFSAFPWRFNKVDPAPIADAQLVLTYKVLKPPAFLLNCNFRI